MSKEEEIKAEEFSYKKILLEIWSWVWSIGLAVIAVLLIKNLLFSTTFVRQQSMYPTLTDWNALIINRIGQVRGVPLKRGDIVVFEAPQRTVGKYAQYPEDSALDSFRKLFWKTLYVKRVIGIAGDQVTVEDGVLYINGVPQDEPYVNPDSPYTTHDFSILVPEGYVFCLGDNRGHSWDSEDFGVIPLEKVEGTANFRIFPFNNFGTID
ncbi:MAG: signal peptidase I [Clostridiales bacterium]|nr:signal peptidase I [Clostridiales bacterium]